MDAPENGIGVGEPLPTIETVTPTGEGFEIAVVWSGGRRSLVDLAPDVLTFRLYAPLRDDPKAFKSVHVGEEGRTIAWGDAIEMPATAVERLADDAMETADFQAWLKKMDFTRDVAAAQLGISRRLVGYFAAGQRIPRYIALACKQLSEEQFGKAF